MVPTRTSQLTSLLQLSVTILAAACGPPSVPPTPAGPATATIAFTHVSLIDGTGRPAQSGMTVVVSGRRVATVGPDALVHVPRGAHVVDGRARYLMPGLWDMHVHLSGAGPQSLGLFIANGVTSIRDMGSDFAVVRALRASILAGDRVGPRIKSSGPMLEFPGEVERIARSATLEPPSRTRVPIASADDAERAIDSLSRLGVDFIKVRTVGSSELYIAIAAAARRHGLTLVGHLVSSPDNFLAGNQRSIEHVTMQHLLMLAPRDRERVTRALAARGVVVVPTFVVGDQSLFRRQATSAAALADSSAKHDSRRRYLSQAILADWRRQVATKPYDSAVSGWDAMLPGTSALLQTLRSAGVRMLPGTDLGVALIYPGFSLHDELAEMVTRLGMSPTEVLTSATRYPAEFFGMQDSLGTIAPGKLADLVLLSADPLADVRNTTHIVGVATGGTYFDRKELDRLLDASAREARH